MNMIKGFLTSVFTIFITVAGVACSCGVGSGFEQNIYTSYEEARAIAVVEIIEIDDLYAKVKILESFKGEMDSLIKVNHGCNLNVEIGEMWLIYAFSFDGEAIESSQCAPNRRFSKMNILSFQPPVDSIKDIVKYQKAILLNQELITLRQRKVLDGKRKKPSGSIFSIKGVWLLIGLLGLNTILMLFFLTKRK